MTTQAESRRHNKVHWEAMAPLWMAWWHRFGPATQPVSDWMVAHARLGAGTRVLDLATGVGEPALSFARALNGRGEVLGVDQSEQMIEYAREQAVGLNHLQFEVQDLEQLNLQHYEPFDVIVSRWGLMFCSDVAKALSQARSYLKPDGILIGAVWGIPERVPMLNLAAQALKQALNRELERLGPGPFSLSDPAWLQAQLAAGGFRLETIAPVEVVLHCESAQAYLIERAEMATSLAEALAKMTVEERAKYDAALESAAQTWRPQADSDRLKLVNQAICFVARQSCY